MAEPVLRKRATSILIGPKDGTARHMTVGAAIAIVLGLTAVGGVAANALSSLGYLGVSPAAQIRELKRADAALAHQDTVTMLRMDALVSRLDTMNQLQLRMAALRCMDPGDVVVVRQAQFPCARIYRALDIVP